MRTRTATDRETLTRLRWEITRTAMPFGMYGTIVALYYRNWPLTVVLALLSVAFCYAHDGRCNDE